MWVPRPHIVDYSVAIAGIFHRDAQFTHLALIGRN